MKMTVIGVVLIVLGVAAFVYGGFHYTDRDTVVDIGPVQATAEHEKSFPIPPALSAVVVIGGAILVVAGLRRR
jgi:uncharacterized membrane protein YidH (DUF202 family)